MDFEVLIKTLEAEVDIYKKFFEIENEKTEIIAQGDVEKLDNMLNTEHMLHMKAQTAEKKRVEVMKSLNLSGKTLAITIDLASGEEKEKLSGILDSFNYYMDSLKKVNGYNDKLVRARLKVISDLSDAVAVDEAVGKNKKQSGKNIYYGKDAKVSAQSDETPMLNKKI